MKEHTIEVRVRYQETDQMGVVYYANYLTWFEIARTEFFRACGIDYRKLEEDHNIYIPVVEAYCRYKIPLTYDNLVTVTAKLTDVGSARLVFEYEVKKEEVITTTGRTKHAFVNDNRNPISVPEDIKRAII